MVTQTMQRGQEREADSTPTFFNNGMKYKGTLKPEQMSAMLDSKLCRMHLPTGGRHSTTCLRRRGTLF
jgi:hypothetical protein